MTMKNNIKEIKMREENTIDYLVNGTQHVYAISFIGVAFEIKIAILNEMYKQGWEMLNEEFNNTDIHYMFVEFDQKKMYFMSKAENDDMHQLFNKIPKLSFDELFGNIYKLGAIYRNDTKIVFLKDIVKYIEDNKLKVIIFTEWLEENFGKEAVKAFNLNILVHNQGWSLPSFYNIDPIRNYPDDILEFSIGQLFSMDTCRYNPDMSLLDPLLNLSPAYINWEDINSKWMNEHKDYLFGGKYFEDYKGELNDKSDKLCFAFK